MSAPRHQLEMHMSLHRTGLLDLFQVCYTAKTLLIHRLAAWLALNDACITGICWKTVTSLALRRVRDVQFEGSCCGNRDTIVVYSSDATDPGMSSIHSTVTLI